MEVMLTFLTENISTCGKDLARNIAPSEGNKSFFFLHAKSVPIIGDKKSSKVIPKCPR